MGRWAVALASVLGPQKVVPLRLPYSILEKLLGARTHVSGPSLPSIPPYPQTVPTDGCVECKRRPHPG